jgi:Regulator of chromosome condensation (RCC1) repeat
MVITRRVMAILAVVAALSLAAMPAAADDGLVEVGLEGRVVQLVADGDSTCALTEAGEVFCWGAGYPDPYRPGRNPMGLAALGALLIAGGAALLLVSRRS